jgi:hypothetical protein
MQLRACFPALLQLALGPTQDMVKGQLALPKGADAHAVVGVLMLLLELVLVLLGTSGDVGILLGEDAYDACGDIVVYDRLVVLCDNVDSEFLYQRERRG